LTYGRLRPGSTLAPDRIGWRWIAATLLFLLIPHTAGAQEAILDLFPIRPINFDVALRQQSFAPNDREITIQAGFTALRYGDLEVRAVYQFFSIHTEDFKTDQHAMFVNPRWNNFIDSLDFPKSMPINRILRHLLFGPLEDRAIPYVGVLAGALVSGLERSSPGHLYGGQVGVRFPVARGISLDLSLQYTQYAVTFRGESGESQQWLFLTGIRY
jgi:hypothetical protein